MQPGFLASHGQSSISRSTVVVVSAWSSASFLRRRSAQKLGFSHVATVQSAGSASLEQLARPSDILSLV